MALTTDLRERFQRYLAGEALPRSIILHGPPGFGKTTIANIIAEKLYSPLRLRVMRVEATETGNVEYIRTRAIEFMRAMSFDGGPKLLIFEEASGLSSEAAEALRVPLEKWADLCRAVFLTNDISKFDGPLQSRCDVIEMTRPPTQECARVLGRVLAAEGHTVEPATVQAFARGHFAAGSDRDLRSLLASAQHWIETKGSLPEPPEADRVASVEELWQSPTGEATDGATLLDALAAEFNKYLVLPDGGVEALALWVAFTWAHEAFAISPILTLSSPTKQAGKSTVFEMLEQLVPSALHPSNLTPAVVFRLRGLAEADQSTPSPTPRLPALCLLMDEADAWIKLDEDMRGILDSGHTRRGAYVLRMIGGAVGKFSSWYPKAIALIDHASSPLPDTLRSRSIIVPMQRKRASETRPKFPRHQAAPILAELREGVARWARDNFAKLRDLGGGDILAAEELDDRAKDNWHSLACIASVAAGGWEQRARRASLVLAKTTRDVELLVELLTDIKEVFDSEGTDALRSVMLVEKLKGFEASPWKENRLTPIKLGKMLRPVGIHPRQLWIDVGLERKTNKQCYERAQFADAFLRYPRMK